MPQTGDFYEVELKPAHLQWGTRGPSRQVETRSSREAYIQIPRSTAKRLRIFKKTDFIAHSSDGLFNSVVRATGSTSSRDPYAKQFQGKGNLKLIGIWLKEQLNAKPGDRVRVEFLSSSEVEFTFIRV